MTAHIHGCEADDPGKQAYALVRFYPLRRRGLLALLADWLLGRRL